MRPGHGGFQCLPIVSQDSPICYLSEKGLQYFVCDSLPFVLHAHLAPAILCHFLASLFASVFILSFLEFIFPPLYLCNPWHAWGSSSLPPFWSMAAAVECVSLFVLSQQGLYTFLHYICWGCTGMKSTERWLLVVWTMTHTVSGRGASPPHICGAFTFLWNRKQGGMG